MIVKSKKGVELTLQTVAVFIICVIVLLVMIFFFTGSVSDGSDAIIGISDSAIASS